MTDTVVPMETTENTQNYEEIVMTCISKFPSLNLEEYKDGIIKLTSNGINFSIKYPTENQILKIESDTELSYLNLINIVAKTKKLDLNKFLKRLSKCISESNKDNFKTVNDSDFEGALKTVSDFDLKSVKELNEIEKNLESSISPLAYSDNKNIKRGKMFSSKDVATLLLSEYKKIKEHTKESNKYTISTVDNNIYCWKINFRNFNKKSLNSSLENLNKKYNYDSIEIQLQFHSELYPNYPIAIKYVRPRLKHSLMHRLSNLRMINSDYWSPSRNAMFVIQKLYKILDKHADIDLNSDKNDPQNFSVGAYVNLESELIKLSAFCGDLDTAEDLDDEKYDKLVNGVKQNSESSNNPNSKSGWDSGTGYGTHGSSNWNPQKYTQIQKEKEMMQTSILNKILNIIITKEGKELKDVFNIVDGSYLIKYIKYQLKENSGIEVDKKKELFGVIFQIIQLLATEDGIFLFADTEKEDGLYSLFQELVKDAEREKKFLDSNELSTSDMILSLNDMIKPIFEKYVEVNGTTKKVIKKIEEDTDENSIYISKMKQYSILEGKVKTNNFCQFNSYHTIAESSLSNSAKKAITRELGFMEKSLPLHIDTSSFYVFDDTAIETGRFIITGPIDTPYDSGIFIFDVLFPNNYPQSAPYVEIINNGGKRYNPNLYDGGKVCLSLLGTWSGSGGEKWVSGESTLYQVILSIQSLILIPDPYFNEPSYESSRGTPSGDKQSQNYNNKIRLYTMTHGINDMLEKPDQYDGTKDMILDHFRLKKDHILKTCGKWVDEAINNKDNYQHQYNRMKELFNKLEEL